MTDIEKEIAERFVRDTADHVLTVLHDDGLYRHLRCSKPDSSIYWFEVVTWPGSLAIRGDMGDSYVFSRISDMFAFFRSNGNCHGINPGYWSEKLSANRRTVQEYSESALRTQIDEALTEYAEAYPHLVAAYGPDKARFDATPWRQRYPMDRNGVREPFEPKTPAEVQGLIDAFDADGELGFEDGARRLLSRLEDYRIVSDTCEWNLTDWDWSFLWACHAVVWAIRQYDAMRAGEPAPKPVIIETATVSGGVL